MVAGQSALAQMQQILAGRHEYARQWQARTGGKVAGYLCSYVPEEVFYAAGVLPVRVLPAHELQDVTASHISGNFCAYCRDVLGQGLLGKYDYLSGLVLSQICLHIRQTYHSWQAHRPTEFATLLWVPPQVETKSASKFFLAQLREFRQATEEWLGRPISDDALREAIAIYDENRRLLRQLYERRKSSPPGISGQAAMEVVISSTVMDKAEHNRLLKALLEELPAQAGTLKDGVRVMVVGSENNDVELMGLIESVGAVVVIDDNCLGNRYFWGETKPSDDPLSAISERYLVRPPCPLLDVDVRRRGAYLMDLAKEYRADGVIFMHQKFCDPHGWEIPVLQPMFEEAGLPCQTLELEFTVPAGQYRTRVEAFVELFV